MQNKANSFDRRARKATWTRQMRTLAPFQEHDLQHWRLPTMNDPSRALKVRWLYCASAALTWTAPLEAEHRRRVCEI
jgi:hypothetical protein